MMGRRVAFPTPYVPGLWIYSLADALKTELLQNRVDGFPSGNL